MTTKLTQLGQYLISKLKITMMMSDVDDDFTRLPTADRLEDLGGLSHTPVGAGGLTHSM